MLKNKELILKDELIEVGVIVSQHEALTISVYFLASRRLDKVRVRVESPDMGVTLEPESVDHLLEAKQTKLLLTCSRPSRIPYQLPELVLSFEAAGPHEHRLSLPCSLNRFVEFREVSASSFYGAAKGLPCSETSFLACQRKVLKDPMSLRLLLPKLTLLNEEELELMQADRTTLKYAGEVVWAGSKQGFLVVQTAPGRVKVSFLEAKDHDPAVIGTLLQTFKELLSR